MTDAAERLVLARKHAGFKSGRQAADRLGINYSSYAQNENGTRGYPADKAELYARAFGVNLQWLITGKGEMAGKKAPGIPIVGKAAAGPDGHYINAYPMGGAPTLDPWPEDDTIAVDVDGDSMIPRFRPREKLVFGARHYDPSHLIGQEVLAELTDGRTLIKVLRRSAEPGKWDLYSINTSYSVIEAVEILWVRPFEGLRV